MFVEFVPTYSGTLNYTYGNTKIEAGVKYVMHKSWIGKIPGHIYELNEFKKYNINLDLNNKKLLIIRTMGAGDMLILSGVIEYIKRTFPNCTIDFACIKEQAELAKCLRGVDNVISMPIISDMFNKYDYHFTVAGLIEGNKNNEKRNIYDVYFEDLGVDMTPDGVAICGIDSSSFKRPFIKTDVYEDIKQEENLIGIHMFAHDPIRQLNPNIIKYVIDLLKKDNKQILLFGSKNEIEACKPYFGETVQYSYGSYADAIKQVAKCSYVICSDSMILHISQAIGIKALTIFGPFSSNCRVKYYKNITSIDTNPDCQCFLHSVGKCPKLEIPGSSLCLNIDPYIIYTTIMNDINGTSLTMPKFELQDISINEYNNGVK